ncbi:MAG: M48 family metalloprotease [Planctomycetaceae bacterium]|nr:M48 family metalloprotease [Planctomycetaceae bacterium]
MSIRLCLSVAILWLSTVQFLPLLLAQGDTATSDEDWFSEGSDSSETEDDIFANSPGPGESLEEFQKRLEFRIFQKLHQQRARSQRNARKATRGIAMAYVIVLAFAALAISECWKQKKQGEGKLWRWVWVTSLIVLLQISPLLLHLFWNSTSRGYLAHGPGVVVVIAVLNSLWLLFSVGVIYAPNMLTAINDNEILDTISRISRAMKTNTPACKGYKSLSDTLYTQAYAIGFVAPLVILTDGIIHRLSPRERDAIIAHEIAHFANRSLWAYLFITPLSAAIGVVLADSYSFEIVLPLTLSLWIGSNRIVSRYFEYDCDRRAGSIIGHVEMASALNKIHAAEQLNQNNWLNFLMYSVASHPHLECRIAALNRHAAESDKTNLTFTKKFVANQHLASYIAAGIWIFALICSLLTADTTGYGSSVLIASALIPFLLLLSISRRSLTLELRRFDTRSSFSRILSKTAIWTILLFLFVSFIFLPAFRSSSIWYPLFQIVLAFWAIVSFFPAFFRILSSIKYAALVSEINSEISKGNLDAALEKAESAPHHLQKLVYVRYHSSLVKALRGDVSTAIREFELLSSEEPRFQMSKLILCQLYYDSGEYRRTMNTGLSLVDALPHDYEAHLWVARSAAALNDFALAEKSFRIAESLSPNNGQITAELAYMAALKGDPSQAEQLMKTALLQAPGSVAVLMVKTELAARYETLRDFETALDAAKSAVSVTPFFIGNQRLKNLEEKLAARRQAEQSTLDPMETP